MIVIRKKSTIYLVLFIAFFLASLFPVEREEYHKVFKILKHLFLLLYYLNLSNKRSLEIILINIFIASSSVFFTKDLSNLTAMVFLGLYRFGLIRHSYRKINFRLSDLKTIIIVFGLSLLIYALVLSLFHNYSSDFFYFKSFLALLLVILFVFSFMKVLDSPVNGNLTYFIAISLFAISNAVFQTVFFIEKNNLSLILTVFGYNLAYFFLNQSFLQSEMKSKKVFRL